MGLTPGRCEKPGKSHNEAPADRNRKLSEPLSVKCQLHPPMSYCRSQKTLQPTPRLGVGPFGEARAASECQQDDVALLQDPALLKAT